jgi:TRAP-type mannitol/chloroaromatic compound transport system permease small subunit
MLRRFCHGIDIVNEWTGRIVSWLLLPLTLIVVIEVILRYGFNRPTIWAWDTNVMLMASLVILGGGYALLHDAHVAIDILVQRLSARKRAILDLITFLFFFVAVGGLLVETTLVAWSSVQTKEMHYSFWAPPMYPLRVVMAVGVLLLFLEGIAKFISKLLAVIGEKKEGET